MLTNKEMRQRECNAGHVQLPAWHGECPTTCVRWVSPWVASKTQQVKQVWGLAWISTGMGSCVVLKSVSFFLLARVPWLIQVTCTSIAVIQAVLGQGAYKSCTQEHTWPGPYCYIRLVAAMASPLLPASAACTTREGLLRERGISQLIKPSCTLSQWSEQSAKLSMPQLHHLWAPYAPCSAKKCLQDGTHTLGGGWAMA